MNNKDLDKLFIDFRENGNDDSFTKLFIYIQRAVFNKISYICGSQELTQDVLQLAWSKVLRSPDKFNAKSGNFFNYFFTIAKNDALKVRDKENKNVRLVEEDLENEFTEENEFELDKLGEYLMNIPEIFRDAIILHFYYEVEIKEIARMLGIEKNTVKTRILRGKKHLKDKLTS